MNNVERMIKESKNFKVFVRSYFRYVSGLMDSLDVDSVDDFLTELEDARVNNRMIFIVGNGGSAATASHMANDLGFGTRCHPEKPLRVMSLTDNTPIIMALANDVGYDQIFLRQLQLHFHPGDKIVVISASGNSPNLIVAVQWFRAQGGKVLGLLGFDGGKLKELCDIAVVVQTPKGEYGPVEDVHMILDHLLYIWFWSKVRNGNDVITIGEKA